MAKRHKQNEDEGTGLFFLLAMLVCIVAPWTLAVLWALLYPGRAEISQAFPTTTEEGKKVRQCQTKAMVTKREAQVQRLSARGRLFTKGFVIRLVILSLLWCWLIYIAVQIQKVMATSTLYQNFDPYNILTVGSSATVKEIKQAFRKMSLKLHPDKNPSNEAASQFMLVKKAYDALTDPVAKRNYALYGNPDGPTRIELGVAIPLVGKDSQALVLILFVLFFIIGLPLTFLWLMSGGNSVGSNGVLNETMEQLASRVTATLGTRDCQDIVVKSKESLSTSREGTEPWELEALGELWKEFGGGSGSSKKQAEATMDVSKLKAEMLMHAYLRRRNELVAPQHQADLEELLPKWRLVTIAIAELAGKRSSDSLLAALRFQRCLVQALDPDANAFSQPLLQAPHFTDERIKQWRKGPRKAAGLPALLELPADERRTSLEAVGFQPDELLDLEEFALSVPRLRVKAAKVFVDGEDNICAGDIATLEVVLERQNLREGEAAGSVHSPLFSSAAVPEAWWALFCTSNKGANPCLHARIDNPGREVTVSMKFRVDKIGKHRCKLHIVSEAYDGLDLEQEVSFEAKQPTEVEEESGDEDANEDDDDDDE